jgi:hypothetical protein
VKLNWVTGLILLGLMKSQPQTLYILAVHSDGVFVFFTFSKMQSLRHGFEEVVQPEETFPLKFAVNFEYIIPNYKASTVNLKERVACHRALSSKSASVT